ncbi:MAG: patatin-like protein [Actinomycetota bacterium]
MTTSREPNTPTDHGDPAVGVDETRIAVELEQGSTIEEEVRFSVVLYGGVSLAIYISGVCLELFNLVRSTTDTDTDTEDGAERDVDRAGQPSREPVTGAVYRALASINTPDLADADLWRRLAAGPDPADLDADGDGAGHDADPVGPDDLPSALRRQAVIDRLTERGHARRMTVDVLSGSSAGGLNALYLSKALLAGKDMGPLKKLWVDNGGLEALIDDENVGRGNEAVGIDGPTFDVDPTDFPASTLSGHFFYKSLYEALSTFSIGEGRPLVDALDTYLTATDLRGIPRKIALDRSTEAEELLHRVVGHFVYGRSDSTGGDRNDFVLDHFMAFVGRASAAHPAAFHPAQLAEIVRLINGEEPEDHHDGCDTSCRHAPGVAFCPADPRWAEILQPNHPDAGGVLHRWYSDGGGIDNKPFGYALRPVGRRRSVRPVDRKLLYVEPSPGLVGDGWADPSRPTVNHYVMGAYNLGRVEPIRHDIAEIEQRNTRIEGIRHNLTDQVERLFAADPTAGVWPEEDWFKRPDELTETRRLRTEGWVARADDAVSSYYRRRYDAVANDLADLVERLAPFDDAPVTSAQIRVAVVRYIGRRYRLDGTEPPTLDRGDGGPDDLDDLPPFNTTPETADPSPRDPVEQPGPPDDRAPADETLNHRRLLVDFDIGYRLRRLATIDQLLADAQRVLLHGRHRAELAPSLATPLVIDTDPDGNATDRTDADLDLLRRITETRRELNRSFLKIQEYGRILRGTDAGDRSILGDRAKRIAATIDELRSADAFANQEIWREAGMARGDTDAAATAADIDLADVFETIRVTGEELLVETSVESRRAIAALPETFRNKLKICWDHYHELDGLVLTSWADSRGELDPVEVIRISPLDAQSIIAAVPTGDGGDGSAPPRVRRKIAGNAVSHFGGFFDERWRALDLMWGRLDAAEILIRHLLPIDDDVAESERRHRETVRNTLITEAQLRILADEPTAVDSLAEIATEETRPPEGTVHSGDPEAALRYLRQDFEVASSLTGDDRRRRAKEELIQRVPRVVGRVMASQTVDRTAPTVADRVRSLSLGRAAQAVTEVARPTTIAGTSAMWLLRLLAAVAALAAVLLPIGVLIASGRDALVGAVLCLIALVLLGAGTTMIRANGHRSVVLVSGVVLLSAAAVLPLWVLAMADDRSAGAAATIAAVFFLGSVVASALLATGGTVRHAGIGAWIGLVVYVAGAAVLVLALFRSWPVVLLVIAATTTALLVGAVVIALHRLGRAIDRIGA